MSTSKTIGVRFSIEEYEKIEKYYNRKDKPFKSLSDAVREIVSNGIESEEEIIFSKRAGLTPTAEAIASFICCGLLSMCLLLLVAVPLYSSAMVIIKAVFGTALFFFVSYFAYNFFFMVYKLKKYEQ
jgi:hypothetical protein